MLTRNDFDFALDPALPLEEEAGTEQDVFGLETLTDP